MFSPSSHVDDILTWCYAAACLHEPGGGKPTHAAPTIQKTKPFEQQSNRSVKQEGNISSEISNGPKINTSKSLKKLLAMTKYTRQKKFTET
jgi:hypothetical protein